MFIELVFTMNMYKCNLTLLSAGNLVIQLILLFIVQKCGIVFYYIYHVTVLVNIYTPSPLSNLHICLQK